MISDIHEPLPSSSSVARAFDAAALTYEAAAAQQKHIAGKLADLLSPYVSEHSLLLDIGCGTGVLKQIRPRWRIIGADIAPQMCQLSAAHMPVVQTDVALWSFKNLSFDSIFSASLLQWVENIEQTFVQFYNALNQGGFAAIACYTDGTLAQLSQAYADAGLASPVQKFHSDAALTLAARNAGFELICSQSESLQRPDTSLANLMRYLRQIGAHTPIMERRGLMTPRQFQRLCACYPSQADGGIISDWHVAYLIAKRPA